MNSQELCAAGRNTEGTRVFLPCQIRRKTPGWFDYKDEVHKLFIYLFTRSRNQYQMMRALINSCVLIRLTAMIFLGFPEMPEAFEENESKFPTA